jgi:hypothetical protein
VNGAIAGMNGGRQLSRLAARAPAVDGIDRIACYLDQTAAIGPDE